MLFDINTAVQVKNHYKDTLMGTGLTPESGYKIDGIFICRKGEVHKAADILLDTDFIDRYPLVGITDENAEDFEIYVYAYTGGGYLLSRIR